MHFHLRLGNPENKHRMVAELTAGQWSFCHSLERELDGRWITVAAGIGLSEARGVLHTAPALIFVCSDANDPMISEALSRGAAALVAHSDAAGTWETAAREVASGGKWISPAIAARFLDSGRSYAMKIDIAGSEHLTSAQRDVLNLMIAGMTRAEVAAKLSIQESTVAYHIRRGLQRLGCGNIRELQGRIIKERFDGWELVARRS